MPVPCNLNCGRTAILKVSLLFSQWKFLLANNTIYFQRPKTGDTLCKECFFKTFETEIHETIIENKLFRYGDKVAIAASGGKDSTVLAHTMKLLNERYNYGLDLFLLSVDEGIAGKLISL